MTTVSFREKKYNQFLNYYCNPGPEGVIGDVLQNVRLQQTDPDAPPRFLLDTKELENRGGNIQDGDYASYSNDGLQSTAIVRDFFNTNVEIISTGFKDQSAENLYTCTNPIVETLDHPLETWNLTQAQTINALSSGRAFRPFPGGYTPRGLPRGPTPQSMNVVGADTMTYNPTLTSVTGIQGATGNTPVGQPGVVDQTPGQTCPYGGCSR